MRKYCIIWVLLFSSVMFMLSPERFYFRYWFVDVFYQIETVIVLGIALTLATQITGIFYLSRKIKALERKDPPQDEALPQSAEAPKAEETPKSEEASEAEEAPKSEETSEEQG